MKFLKTKDNPWKNLEKIEEIAERDRFYNKGVIPDSYLGSIPNYGMDRELLNNILNKGES